MWPPWWVQPWGVQGEPWRWGAPQTARTEGPRLENQSYQGARRGRRRRKHQRRGLNETRVPTTLEDTPLPQTTSQQRAAIPAPLPTTSQQTERAAIPAPLPTTSQQSESAVIPAPLPTTPQHRIAIPASPATSIDNQFNTAQKYVISLLTVLIIYYF